MNGAIGLLIFIIIVLAVAIVVLILIMVNMRMYTNELMDESDEALEDLVESEKAVNTLKHDVTNAYIGYQKLQDTMDEVLKQETGKFSGIKKFETVKDLAVAVKMMSDFHVDYFKNTSVKDETLSESTEEEQA